MATANKQVVCNVLMELAKEDRDIVVLCSDSRGSGSMTPFADALPEQFIEVGIAEQSLVSMAAGLANAGKKPMAVSPASFLSTRSMEQVKVDCAYSHMNVKLLGISGGVSYGALGMTHHSTTDIATIGSIPGMRVYFPSDRFQTEKLTRALMADKPSRTCTRRVTSPSRWTRPRWCARARTSPSSPAASSSGTRRRPRRPSPKRAWTQWSSTCTADMYCIKPIDREAVLKAAKTGKIITVEEHVAIGGLGSMVAQVTAAEAPCRVVNLTLPDSPVVTGNSKQVFAHYGLDAAGIEKAALELVK